MHIIVFPALSLDFEEEATLRLRSSAIALTWLVG
jgi:hypothetical protein